MLGNVEPMFISHLLLHIRSLVYVYAPSCMCLLLPTVVFCCDLGYDSDEGGKGGRGASGGAKKVLSVQDQMVGLFWIYYFLCLFSLLCGWFFSACGVLLLQYSITPFLHSSLSLRIIPHTDLPTQI